MTSLTNDCKQPEFNTINWRATNHFDLKMTSEQVVETSVTANNNSPTQGYIQADGHTQPT